MALGPRSLRAGASGQPVVLRRLRASTALGFRVPGTTPSAIVASAGLAMTQLTAGRVYQRTSKTGGGQGKGSGAIAVPITLQAAASRIEYRLRDARASGNPTLQDWTTAATNVAASATVVPCSGIPADAKQYLLDLRANGDDAQVVLGTSAVMMGRILAGSGQSQMVRQFAPGSSDTIAGLNVEVSPFGMVYATYYDTAFPRVDTPKWAPPTDAMYGSTFAAEFLRRQVAASGVACAWVGHSVGGTAIAAWAPGSTNNVALRAILDAVGGFEAFHWHQGGDDAGANTAKAAYKTALDGLLADVTAHNAIWGSSYAKALTAMATRLSGGAGTIAGVTAIRQASREWAAANGGVYLEPHDITLADSVHQNQAGAITLAQHAHRVLTGGNAGPTLGTPTRTSGSAVLSIPVTLPTGATDLVLTGNAYTRFSVFPAGQTTGALAVSALAYDKAGRKLTLTLAAAPADTQALDVYAFLHPDPSGSAAYADMIRDDRVDGDGIAVGRSLEPSTAGPITVAALAAAATGPAMAVGDVVLINTYDSRNGAASTATGWNNLNQSASTGSAAPLALKKNTGADAALSAFVANGNMNTGNSAGFSTGNNSGDVPDDVLLTSIFADKTGGNGSGTSTQIALTTTGFIAGTKWKVEVVGSRAVASRLQNIAVNGGTPVSANAGNNAKISATFSDVSPDANGQIAVQVTQNSNEQFCYLNAVRLTRTA